jgi:hypothetical protein
MNRPRSSSNGFPLFQGEPDIWNSLDETTQEQVLDCLALLLLRHLQQTARHDPEERSFTKGTPT